MNFLGEFLKKQDVEFFKDFSLKTLSAIAIGSTTEYFIKPDSVFKFLKVLECLISAAIPFKVIGRMTNILPSDNHFYGAYISTSKIDKYYVAENVLTVECGAALSRVIKEIASENLGGLHQLYGIPGSVGGMIYSNAGAYGKCISDPLIDAVVFSPDQGIFTLSKNDMDFAYRDSIFKHRDIYLLSARFLLNKDSSENIFENLGRVITLRKRSQPYSDKSLGSVFKRCGGVPVSRLIDELGLKGLSVGGAKISEKHAGFIINDGNATAADVKQLIAIIKDKLYNSYGIIAEEEIEIME